MDLPLNSLVAAKEWNWDDDGGPNEQEGLGRLCFLVPTSLPQSCAGQSLDACGVRPVV
jgi:hypothetical protein